MSYKLLYQALKGIRMFAFLVFTVFTLIKFTQQHGYLVDPPSRAACYQKSEYRNYCTFFDTPQGYFCGGTRHRTEDEADRNCGVCGDMGNYPVFNLKKTFIFREYRRGAKIIGKALLTANHKGYFRFSVAPYKANQTELAQDLKKGRLIVLDKSRWWKGDPTTYRVDDGQSHIEVELRLPSNVWCDHCIFQWHYWTGNNWGVCPETKKGDLSCGAQETFRGCADIAIKRETAC